MLNVIGNLNKLDTMKDSEKTFLYMKLLNNPEGELLLADLMDQFFEFKPVKNDHEAGAQSVLIYIKNRVLGIHEDDPAPTTEA